MQQLLRFWNFKMFYKLLNNSFEKIQNKTANQFLRFRSSFMFFYHSVASINICSELLEYNNIPWTLKMVVHQMCEQNSYIYWISRGYLLYLERIFTVSRGDIYCFSVNLIENLSSLHNYLFIVFRILKLMCLCSKFD